LHSLSFLRGTQRFLFNEHQVETEIGDEQMNELEPRMQTSTRKQIRQTGKQSPHFEYDHKLKRQVAVLGANIEIEFIAT
jgi:hypothetical protein